MMHRLFLTLSATILIAACSSYEPEVLGVTSQEVRYLGRSGEWREELIIEIEARDQDGFRELDRVYVIQDEKELYWEVSSESWQANPQDGFIRLSRLSPPPGEPLPRGGYRVELFDLGGRSGERTFTLPLLPEQSLLQAREERLRRAGEHLRLLVDEAEPSAEAQAPGREEPPGAEELRDIGLIILRAGGFEPRLLLRVEELGPLSPGERRERLTTALEGEESGRVYLASQLGDSGPLFLLEIPRLPQGVSEG